MFVRALLSGLLLAVSGVSYALDLTCESALDSASLTALPKKEYARFELNDALSCSWSTDAVISTPSLLFKVPASESSVEIEIGTWLNVDETTAVHVALLDQNRRPIKWIPFNAFRERKGYLTARFFVEPNDSIDAILVGGAIGAEQASVTRTYSPLSSNMLRFAGLITAREVNAEFNLVPTGKIRVRIRKPRSKRIPVTD